MILGLATAAFVLIAPIMAAQDKIAIKPMPKTGVTGSEMYGAYCASCHGLDGKGAGPAAKALKTPMPDLTKIAQKNGGKFDSGKVAMSLGLMPESGAHGSKEMPVWGDLFRENRDNEMTVRLRISNLVTFIEKIQDPPVSKEKAAAAGAAPQRVPLTSIPMNNGQGMFQAYCSSCHGMDGKGAGPAAKSLKAKPGDLTALTKNNGGNFPSYKIMGLLGDMRGTDAHGSKEMPVWGDVLRSVERADAVQLRLTNITSYLKSIQAK